MDNPVRPGQIGLADSFLPVPLTVLVTDGNATPLTNAPVTIAAVLGSAQLAVTNNDAPATNLAVRTDANGLASVLVYFPPELM